MNWYKQYKLAQQATQDYFLPDPRISPRPENMSYVDIGHPQSWTTKKEENNKDEQVILWALVDGRVEKIDPIPIELASTSHNNFWGPKIRLGLVIYTGRYEVNSGVLSIAAPQQFKKIPPQIFREFPNAQQIYVF